MKKLIFHSILYRHLYCYIQIHVFPCFLQSMFVSLGPKTHLLHRIFHFQNLSQWFHTLELYRIRIQHDVK